MYSSTRRATRLAALVLTVWPAAAAGDDGSVSIVVDKLGRVQAAVPRQHTRVQMRAEQVVLVPFYRRKVSRYPALLVNARFEFYNPGAAEKVLMGFPELRAKRKSSYRSGESNRTTRRTKVLKRPTIALFSASHGLRTLQVKALPGRGDYRKWYVFTVPIGSRKSAKVRNIYVAYLGRYEFNQSAVCKDHFFADYVLHTGATWNGAIGHGRVELRAGGFEQHHSFAALRPTKKNDLHFTLGNFDDPVMASGCGDFNENRVLHASSTRPDSVLPHYAALVMDRDPTTAWIDDGKSGGVGAWISLPTRRRSSLGWISEGGEGKLRRVKGLTIQAGTPAKGAARVKRLRIDCLGRKCRPAGGESDAMDCDGRPRKVGTFDLPPDSRPHAIRFSRPKRCGALRLTVKALHGSSAEHATIAEAYPLY